MNEIEFVRLSRTLKNHMVVLFFDTGRQSPTTLLNATRSAVGAGLVLRFVDPAKPLLVYRRSGDTATGVDFFHDVLYATTPALAATTFDVWEHDTHTVENHPPSMRWRRHLEEMLNQPLDGDTALFEAYREGRFGSEYREPGPAHQDRFTLETWLDAHLDLVGFSAGRMTRVLSNCNVWEDHDVYRFA